MHAGGEKEQLTEVPVRFANELNGGRGAVCMQGKGEVNKLLGFVRRNSRFIHSISVRRTLYLGLVRAHLGYATQVWAPQGIELISKLERIQRRATKFILCLPFLTKLISLIKKDLYM